MARTIALRAALAIAALTLTGCVIVPVPLWPSGHLWRHY